MCITQGCNKPIFIKKRGLCKYHYNKWVTTTRKDNKLGAFGKVQRRDRAREITKLVRSLKPKLPDLSSPQIRTLIGMANKYNKCATVRGYTAINTFDFVIWLDKHYGCLCKYCGVRADSHDHIIPLSRGGAHSLDNLQLVCWSCNRAKWTMTEDEFLEYRKRMLQHFNDK